MNPYLLPALKLSPPAVERLLSRIPRDRWDERLDAERFTVREAIAHLADWEPVGLERLQLAVAQPGATCHVFDEGQRAIEGDYQSTDPVEESRQWGEHRARTIAFIEGLAEPDWAKTFHHPERGVMTVYDQANLLLGHDLYHVEHLSQFL